MPTDAQNKAMHLYVAMMEEVNIRLTCINVALLGRTMLPQPAIIEFCYLQLRFLCEMIALGCLVVHGDIEEADKLRGEPSADKIVKRLDALHPDFYPHPVRQVRTKPGHFHLDDVSSGFLTKADILKLNGISGDALHRGSLKNLLSTKKTTQAGLKGIKEWTDKITTLLSQHRIGLLDGSTHFLCVLHNVDDNNRVQVAIAEGPVPPAEPTSQASRPKSEAQ